ncbi:glycosyltransferase family A protein [Hymenobacter sp. YC55]|uniref:glycosyltransferase family 2 protein n=1 Tax=Hymenobacter sp. YC55 TaxID=3034019 RepID=UPI0023F8A5FD|nr:glycosyltransferase family A protein [Hymenobacter sp. YC55]MDF7810186.1 glycosyltransferase family A protein [Hymenobacter sp. YC55]
MKNLVSIVIPCFNHGKYLYDAIMSVERFYGLYSYEIIIVNDGSTDSYTNDIVSSLNKDKYIVINQSNQGLAAARNNGINIASGEYIIPLDSDNMLEEAYLKTGVGILEKDPSVDVVYGDAIFFGDNDGIRKTGLSEAGSFDLVRILNSNYIDACAIFRKSAWKKVGGYDGKMPAMGHEDWEMWIHIFLSGGNLYYLNEVCFRYRIVVGSMLVTDLEAKHKANKDYIYNKHTNSIINNLSESVKKLEASKHEIINYLAHYKLRSIFKLILGYKF